jgi:hypothetical protein
MTWKKSRFDISQQPDPAVLGNGRLGSAKIAI